MKRAARIMNWSQAKQAVDQWREQGDRIVFTNGCFDIIHQGHVSYLEQAADLGDRLIIGLNSDDSTTRLKGPGRPINNQASRAYVLAALAVTDLVVVFDEDTPLDLIIHLTPDILSKGGDYRPEDVVGGDHVIEHGGHVIILPYLDGYSTTSIEERIKGDKNN